MFDNITPTNTMRLEVDDLVFIYLSLMHFIADLEFDISEETDKNEIRELTISLTKSKEVLMKVKSLCIANDINLDDILY